MLSRTILSERRKFFYFWKNEINDDNSYHREIKKKYRAFNLKFKLNGSFYLYCKQCFMTMKIKIYAMKSNCSILYLFLFVLLPICLSTTKLEKTCNKHDCDYSRFFFKFWNNSVTFLLIVAYFNALLYFIYKFDPLFFFLNVNSISKYETDYIELYSLWWLFFTYQMWHLRKYVAYCMLTNAIISTIFCRKNFSCQIFH